ncbi:hypothetical protein ACQP2P_38680 [Dactylosporangium sp. CA-139114]|uniref:hypothetical protein n=1 Tax=Dactylosporangium sp. CA-139114 TaxID=3239931 RepID=UPI003D99AE9C
MYFVLHPHGQRMSGRWVGLSYDGKIVTGWGAMGRTAEEATEAINFLIAGESPDAASSK